MRQEIRQFPFEYGFRAVLPIGQRMFSFLQTDTTHFFFSISTFQGTIAQALHFHQTRGQPCFFDLPIKLAQEFCFCLIALELLCIRRIPGLDGYLGSDC